MDYDFSEFVESILSRGCLFAFSVCIIIHACRRVVRQDKEITPELEESIEEIPMITIKSLKLAIKLS